VTGLPGCGGWQASTAPSAFNGGPDASEALNICVQADTLGLSLLRNALVEAVQTCGSLLRTSLATLGIGGSLPLQVPVEGPVPKITHDTGNVTLRTRSGYDADHPLDHIDELHS